MNNYFSIGLDASIALGFHEARSSNPKLFSGRTINKIWYGKIGLEEFVLKSFVRLADILEIKVDDKTIVLDKSIEGIMIININSYAGGVNLWGNKDTKEFKKLQIDDTLLEVVGITGVPHLGSIISGLNSPIKIAQGSTVSIIHKPSKKTPETAMQIDGEPFNVESGTIDISFLRQVTMLAHKGFKTQSASLTDSHDGKTVLMSPISPKTTINIDDDNLQIIPPTSPLPLMATHLSRNPLSDSTTTTTTSDSSSTTLLKKHAELESMDVIDINNHDE
eukprot:gene15951-18965_t